MESAAHTCTRWTSVRTAVAMTIACLVLLATVTQSFAGTIVVAWDQEGLVCEQSVPAGTAGTLYLLAHLTDIHVMGTTGAEFRLDGFPPEWQVVHVTPNPQATVVIGNPLTGGCNIAFPECQTGTNGIALLYRVDFFAVTAVVERVLSVRGHSQPSNPDFPCPLLQICDICFCVICGAGGTAAIDYPGYCSVGAEQRSWTEVRALYR